MIKTTPLLLRFEFLQSVFFMSWSLHAANLIAKKHTISRVCISFNFGFCFWHFKIVVIKLKVNNLVSLRKTETDTATKWGWGGEWGAAWHHIPCVASTRFDRSLLLPSTALITSAMYVGCVFLLLAEKWRTGSFPILVFFLETAWGDITEVNRAARSTSSYFHSEQTNS